MHIERIYIQKNFQPNVVADPFMREHIGIGIFLNEGDDLLEAEKEAKEYISNYIKDNTATPDHNHIETRTIDEENVIQGKKIVKSPIKMQPDKEIMQKYLKCVTAKDFEGAKKLTDMYDIKTPEQC
jgi:hypothetical protein